MTLPKRLVERATQPPVLTWFAGLQALVVVALLVRHAATIGGVVDGDCKVVVGDFLAFHTGATLIASGQGDALYDLARQHAVQSGLTGCSLDRWQPYVNPPLLAAGLAPLVRLGPRAALHAFGALCTLALVLALSALGRALPALRAVPGAWRTAALLVVGFAPVASTLDGGQNTALTLALFAALYAAIQARREAWAGVWLGLLSYKPMLLPVLVLVLVAQRRWRALGVAGAVTAAHYALGAAVAGADWPVRLLATGAHYRTLEWADNVATHFSLLPFFERVLPGPLGTAVACAAIAWVALVAVRRARAARQADTNSAATWSLAFAAALLASAHLQYYDFGLVALPALLGIEHRLASGRSLGTTERLALAAGYLGYPAYALSARIGFQPLTVAVAVLFVWLWREA